MALRRTNRRMDTRMLVVDDEPAIRHRISDLLIAEGDAVATAADVQAVLARIAQDPPDR